MANITENSIIFSNVRGYIERENRAENYTFKYLFSGRNEPSVEIFKIPGKRVHMMVYVKESDIWAFFDENHEICISKEGESIIIDKHTGFYFFKGMSSRDGSLVYHSSDFSIKIIPKLEFCKLESQKNIVEFCVDVSFRIMCHKILKGKKIAVLGENGFFGIYSFQGELEKRMKFNFLKMSMISFTQCERYFAVSGTGNRNFQSLQLLCNKRGRVQILQTKNFNFHTSLMDIQIKRRPDGRVFVFAIACRDPFKLFVLSYYGRILEIRCQYSWAHKLCMFWPEGSDEGVFVTGGESRKLSILKIKDFGRKKNFGGV